MKYHFIRMMDVKMIIVDATRSNIDDNVICFSYLVARLCMVERVDLVDPERIKLIFVPFLIDGFEELCKALVVLFVYNAITFDGLWCGYYFLYYFWANQNNQITT